jgi:hypothetical protein
MLRQEFPRQMNRTLGFDMAPGFLHRQDAGATESEFLFLGLRARRGHKLMVRNTKLPSNK